MNQLIFEGRCLLGMVGSIMRREELKILYQRMDWERMYKLAEYHHVVPMVYLGILGHGKDVPARCMERFFSRYWKYLELMEHWEESESEVLTLFNMKKIPCVLLASNQIREMYPIHEAAGVHSLVLLTEKESYALAKGFLIDLGYERRESLEGAGERFQGMGGRLVELYWDVPFKPAYYRKEALKILKRACPAAEGGTVRRLGQEDALLFLLAWASYRYASNSLTLQEVLDLYVLHRQWRANARRDIEEEGDGFKLGGFWRKLLTFSYMWFGEKQENYLQEQNLSEDSGAIYDALEKRLLTKGMIQTEIDPEILALQGAIEAEEEREQRKERWKKLKGQAMEILRDWKKRFLPLKGLRGLKWLDRR